MLLAKYLILKEKYKKLSQKYYELFDLIDKDLWGDLYG